MATGGFERRLLIAGLLIACLMVVCPLVVRWADTEEVNWFLVALSCGPAVPVLGFVVLTLTQQRRGVAVTSFEAGPLMAATYLMSVWVLGGGVLGYFIILLAVIIFPLSGVLIALAWVRPLEGRDEGLTVALAILSLPFIGWFIGRADEYVSEALIAGTAIAAIMASLALLRRRSRHSLPLRV